MQVFLIFYYHYMHIYILIFDIKATKDRAERKKEERGMTSLTSVKFETMP